MPKNCLLLCVVSCVLTCCGCGVKSGKPVDYERMLGNVCVTLARLHGPAPTPEPTPSGVCQNCRGTGRIGDGTVSVPCPECGGDGVRDTQTDHRLPDGQGSPSYDTDEAFSRVIVWTRPGNEVCSEWCREIKPRLEAAGWAVTEKTDSEGDVPRFRVVIGQDWWTVDYLSIDKLDLIVREQQLKAARK